MNKKHPFPDPAEARPLLDEADIGSGEKTQAERETEAIIRQIPPLEPSDDKEDEGHAIDDTGHRHGRAQDEDEPDMQLDQLDPVPPKGD